MQPYQYILDALKRSQMTKGALVKCTGIPYGVIDHAIEVLLLEGKIIKVDLLRYQLKGGGNVNTGKVPHP
jgi:hypothetical protein